MAKKQYFLIVDVETTITDKVADFGAVICDRKGIIAAQCAVMVNDVYGVDPLYYNEKAGELWTKQSLAVRMARYNDMLISCSFVPMRLLQILQIEDGVGLDEIRIPDEIV